MALARARGAARASAFRSLNPFVPPIKGVSRPLARRAKAAFSASNYRSPRRRQKITSNKIMSTETPDPINNPIPTELENSPLRSFGSRLRRIQRVAGQTAALARRVGWRIGVFILAGVISMVVWRAVTSQAKPQTAPTRACYDAVAKE